MPPGHMVVFYQRILHEIPRQSLRRDSFRLFVGWRLTNDARSLQDIAAKTGVPDTEAVIESQAVPLLPSGQTPPMYSRIHLVYWLPKIMQWSDSSVRDICKVHTKIGGQKMHVVPRYMSSLEHLGIPLYRPYSHEERSIMWPDNTWTLEGKHLSLHHPVFVCRIGPALSPRSGDPTQRLAVDRHLMSNMQLRKKRKLSTEDDNDVITMQC